ncbi:MAG: toll/interleukin-1 receptor domain-containing protein [Rubrivivax sp.]
MVGLRATLDAVAMLPGVTLAKRVVAEPGRGLRVTWQCISGQENELTLRQALTGLHPSGRAPVRIETPDDDAHFDAMLGDAPAMQSLLAPARYAARGCWLALPCGAAALWPRLAQCAVSLGQIVGYQTNLYPHRPPSSQQREALLNLQQLLNQPGVPAALLALQDDRVRRLRGARWLAEDLVLASTPAGSETAVRGVESAFRNAHAWIDAGPALDFQINSCRVPLELACGVDTAWAAETGYVASQAQDLASTLQTLDPEDDASALPANVARATTQLLSIPAGDGANDPPYVFISYAHADTQAMHATRAALNDAGLHVWVDEHLQAGEQWAQVLEDRIRNCAVLLSLMSPAAAASAFVRRELRFADATERRLLWVQLEPTELRDGLAMLLLPLQWIDADRPDARHQLIEAVRRWIAEDAPRSQSARRARLPRAH